MFLTYSFTYYLRSITWFVSNCNAPSGRDEYVTEMQKVTKVDIFGKCSGTLDLSKQTADERQTLSDYKFYVAFENSKCPEYATEKVHKILNLGIWDNPPVPIVMGPNKSWYETHLPRQSFIHVDDFDNPKELGQYLVYLGSNDDVYFEYLKWRRYYQHTRDSTMRCKLCDMLVNNKLNQEKQVVISDFMAFWKKTECDRNITFFSKFLILLNGFIKIL